MSVKRAKKVVLTVDDVSMNLMVIKNALSEYLDVRVAKSGELALFILGSVSVDLILLDIEMPGMSGFDFVKIIRNIPEVKDTPIIFVTSHSNVNVIGEALRSGARDYIVKPINTRILKEKVFKALDMPEPQ